MHTKMPMRTRAFIFIAAIFAFGLAAYGFGFFPIVQPTKAEAAVAPTCSQKCQKEYCYESKEGYQCTKELFAMCLVECAKEAY